MVLKFSLIHTAALPPPRPPTLYSDFLFCLRSTCYPPAPSHPVSQYVAHSCFCLKTVQLINWWVCGCNKNHDSRWTIHLLLLNFSNDTGSSLGLVATLPPPRDCTASQQVCGLLLWLWFTADCGRSCRFTRGKNSYSLRLLWHSCAKIKSVSKHCDNTIVQYNTNLMIEKVVNIKRKKLL